MSVVLRPVILLVSSVVLGVFSHAAEPPPVHLFIQAASQDREVAESALEGLAAAWRDSYASMIVDLASVMPPSRYGHRGDAAGLRESPGAQTRRRLIQFLERQTGQQLRDDLKRWHRWTWQLPYEPHPNYMLFKGTLYRAIDPRMERFFPSRGRATIRLDEIVWGGVAVNGIPPLDHPEVLAASDASYLGDDHVVFGVALNGEARAYPKRILAWHELARDEVGGVELTVVYCTLCGTVIPYDSTVGGKLRKLGTSGFLYRSNKLMFDEETHSLWSTITGTPVVGELVGAGLRLRHYPVVTTTWGEWRDQHPDTTVLSLETGHRRDYSEGAAYRSYFASDTLMFAVPGADVRLANKSEILALRLEPRGGAPISGSGELRSLAISATFLLEHPLYELDFAGHQLVIVTTEEGANRVYERGEERFAGTLDAGLIEDAHGRRWRITEQALVLGGAQPRRLARVPAHRAFWFGWHAQFPDTELVR